MYLWVYLSIIAMILTGLHPVCYKILNKDNKNIFTNIALIFFILGILSSIYLFFNYKSTLNYIKQNNANLKYIFALSLIILAINICISNAIKLSPNTCFCLLIINLNILVTLLFDIFFLKYNFNYKSIIGIFITLIGLSIIIYYSKH